MLGSFGEGDEDEYGRDSAGTLIRDDLHVLTTPSVGCTMQIALMLSNQSKRCMR